MKLLQDGLSAEEVVERLTSADEGRDQRQLGVVDREGRSASFTGAECLEWAGGRTGPCYAAQGNILVSAETVDAIEAGRRVSGTVRLAMNVADSDDVAQRLVAAGSMNAAKAAGKVRMEGKDYVMADGDVVEFRFNV